MAYLGEFVLHFLAQIMKFVAKEETAFLAYRGLYFKIWVA